MIALIDTSSGLCQLTLVNDNEQYDYEWQADRTLAKELLSYLRDCLAKHNATFEDLSGLGVMQGPGSFTGLRIGMTVWNTLADSLTIPIVGASGDTWQAQALEHLRAGENDRLVLPHYGREASITKPRK